MGVTSGERVKENLPAELLGDDVKSQGNHGDAQGVRQKLMREGEAELLGRDGLSSLSSSLPLVRLFSRWRDWRNQDGLIQSWRQCHKLGKGPNR